MNRVCQLPHPHTPDCEACREDRVRQAYGYEKLSEDWFTDKHWLYDLIRKTPKCFLEPRRIGAMNGYVLDVRGECCVCHEMNYLLVQFCGVQFCGDCLAAAEKRLSDIKLLSNEDLRHGNLQQTQ